jgi:amino-acid N-acetyltransferase
LRLAEAVAVHLHADKLFFLVPGAEITAEHFIIPHNIGISEEGKVPALDLQELDAFISANKDYGSADREKLLDLLGLAGKACESGVTRAHILDGAMAGTLPCEIFSDLGSGTMVYTSNYGKIRDMTHDDIPAVLSLMQPFVERGILLPRTKQMLDEQYTAFIVYELDGAIRACASLVPYSDGQMEIAALAVDASCSHLGIGPKLMSFLKNRARERKAKGVFLLTTQTADWFENLGFVPSDISTLPQQRRAIWTPGRGSKVLRMEL